MSNKEKFLSSTFHTFCVPIFFFQFFFFFVLYDFFFLSSPLCFLLYIYRSLAKRIWQIFVAGCKKQRSFKENSISILRLLFAADGIIAYTRLGTDINRALRRQIFNFEIRFLSRVTELYMKYINLLDSTSRELSQASVVSAFS